MATTKTISTLYFYFGGYRLVHHNQAPICEFPDPAICSYD